LNTKHILYSSLLLIALSYANLMSGQGSYQYGLLPTINFNKKLEKDWSLNLSVQSRQLIGRGEFNGVSDVEYDYILTDYSVIAAKKFGLNSRFNLGYLLRVREGNVFQRLMQRYIVTQRLRAFRLSHRIALDQTLSDVESTEFRCRYRITSEIPLNGQSLDPKEVYLKVNAEVLGSLQDSEYGLEIRFVPVIGYDITHSNKIELGLDYRVSSFLDDGGNSRHVTWAVLSWFLEF